MTKDGQVPINGTSSWIENYKKSIPTMKMREAEIWELRNELGMTFGQIAEKFGISAERARQINEKVFRERSKKEKKYTKAQLEMEARKRGTVKIWIKTMKESMSKAWTPESQEQEIRAERKQRPF